MSEESTTPDLVELVRRQSEAGNRRDLDAVTSSFAPDAVFEGRALGDTFEGRAAIRSFLEDWFGSVRGVGVRVRGSPRPRQRSCVCRGHSERSSGWQRRSRSTTRGMGLRLGARLDRAPYDLRHRRGPCCRRTPRRGTGVGDVAGERGDRAPGVGVPPGNGGLSRGALRRPTTSGTSSTFRGWPEQHAYYGIDGARQFIEDWTAAFDDWEIELVEAYDAGGDKVVGILRQRGRSKSTGVPVDMQLAMVFTLRNGQVITARNVRRPSRSPQSRGAGGVGDVGEPGPRAVDLR